MDSAAIIARLKDRVPDLRKVGIAAELQAVLDGKLADQTGASAYVIGLGARGGRPDNAAGAFTQEITETISVIVTVRSIDNRAGDKAVDEIEALKVAVRAAIAGWGPEGAFDLYALSREATVAFKPGYYAYALEFTAADQLRITE
jgi:hypothetical protein